MYSSERVNSVSVLRFAVCGLRTQYSIQEEPKVELQISLPSLRCAACLKLASKYTLTLQTLQPMANDVEVRSTDCTQSLNMRPTGRVHLLELYKSMLYVYNVTNISS